MPRKGENIYKRKDGRWEGRYIRSYDSEHKAKYAYVYGKTYSEVKRKLTEQRGNVQKVQPTKNKSSTYGELLDCWLHSMQLNTKESTQARYTHLIKTHIKPHLGAVQLSQLTTDAIEIFIEQQLTDGRLDNSGGLSPKTVTDILTIIKSTIEYARYKELPVICNLSKLSIKKKEKEMRVFTPSEQESLIGTLTNDMDHSKFGVLLSLYTGIRVGELCALQWEDFDLAHSKLKIRKTMQRIQDLGNGSVSKTKIVITEPKSQCSIREIPLPLFIVDVAKKFASNPKAYILTGTDRYIEPRTMQNRFKSYVKECNVEPANFHVLRHTFATRCVEVGFEVKAYCPECDTALSGDTASRQYAFPVIGGPSVGKTCFINMAIDQMMSDVAPARSWKMSFISDTEEKDHALAMKSLNQGVRLMKTELNSLTAYQLMLKLPNEKIGRRIYVYDISGEMFSSSSDVQNNLAYSYANGFIFIIDPLTLNQFAMDVEDKVDLNAYGASSKDFDDILNIMLINLEKMFGLKDKDTLKRNLAVVINKVDIPTLEEKIGETAAQQYLAENAKTCKSYMDARDAVCRNFLRGL